jgi:hypothetical protein
VTTWNDLPKQPWPEHAEPDPAVLADWLRALPGEQLVWLLERQPRVWSEESHCFQLNHEARISGLQEHVAHLQERVNRAYAALTAREVFSP